MTDSKTPEVACFHFDESGFVPNHPELPVLLYRQALSPDQGSSLADLFEERFDRHQWRGSWRWGVFPFHHYHSNAHEVLGVASGEAELTLGGPKGERVQVKAGDVVVLPAGTGHKKERSSDDFQVVGAYPEGQEDKDLIKDDQPLTDLLRKRVRETTLPDQDPLFGSDGPLLKNWQA